MRVGSNHGRRPSKRAQRPPLQAGRRIQNGEHDE
jgi:hypothetical protein